MADDWLVLSDRDHDAGLPGPDLVESGLFVIEFSLPLTGPSVLLDFHCTEGWDRTFTLFHDPASGFVLIHRQGKTLVRHALPMTSPQLVGTGRLSLRFDAPGRRWDMRFDLLGAEETPPICSSGSNPLPLRPSDLHALSLMQFRATRHGSVLWFGLTRSESLPSRAPWIGLRTPIETARGPVLAGNLKPGDLVSTSDGGLLPLRRIRRLSLPARGSFAPVILRAPFFSVSSDLLVSSDQLIAVSGPEVEYLFSEEEVLVAAGHLVDGKSALAEQRRAVAPALRLEFDYPILMVSDGSLLLAARDREAPPRRILKPYEVLTLMTLLGRAGHRRIA